MKHYRNQNNETQIIDEESYLAINGASRLNIGNEENDMKELSVNVQDVFDAAIEKLGINGWEPYRWEAATDGHIVTGSVPFGVYRSGPKKGQPVFDSTDKKTVFVSNEEIKAMANRYEAETGKCWNCKGTGEIMFGWSKKNGVIHKICSRCDGCGTAPGPCFIN
jgi:hypothetical protein